MTRIKSNQQHLSVITRGFTLIELIIVIVLLGVIGAVIGPLIGNKFFAVAQSTERAHWVQQAEYAMFHLRQDLANSVPNSISTSEPLSGANQVVEFLAIEADSPLLAARYRNKQYAPYDRLQLNNETSFDIFTAVSASPAYVSVNTTSATQMRLDWQALQAGGSTGTIARVSAVNAIAGGVENSSPGARVTLNGSHSFSGHSPYFRAYFSNGPVAYQCDLASGYLYRVSNYTDLGTNALSTRSAIGQRDRVIDKVTGCQFAYIPGTAYGPPSVKVKLLIGNGTEAVTLIDTIQLSNGS